MSKQRAAKRTRTQTKQNNPKSQQPQLPALSSENEPDAEPDAGLQSEATVNVLRDSDGMMGAQPLPKKKNLPVLSSESFAVRAQPEPQPQPEPQKEPEVPKQPEPQPPQPPAISAQEPQPPKDEPAQEDEFCYLDEEEDEEGLVHEDSDEEGLVHEDSDDDACIPLEEALEAEVIPSRLEFQVEMQKPLKMEVRAADFGPCNRKVFLGKNPAATWDVHLPLPDGRTFVIEFRGGPAPIPQMVADFLANQYPRSMFWVE